MKQTLYQILGVDPKASAEEITVARARGLAEATTAGSQDSTRLSLLRQAGEILSDPVQRAAYDRSLTGGATRRPTVSYDELEPAFFQTWGKWIAAALVLIGLIGWWATRGKSSTPQKATAERIVSPTVIQPRVPAGPPARQPTDAKVGAPPSGASTAPAAARSAEDVFADVSRSVARVNVMDGSGRAIAFGSGVVIDQGTVLTSCHVATRGTALTVKFSDGLKPATIQLADEALDLCRLSVPELNAPAVAIGTVEGLRTGQRVYAVGAPMGLDLTISEGIVSSLRNVDEGTVIQTTAPISPGSSGGGLFDVSGRLVGIMTFQHRYGQNLNFALPADWIGQMRARGPGDARQRFVAGAEGPKNDSPAVLVLGQWSCFGSISGRSGHYTFEPDGNATIAMADGKVAALNYRVSGKVLQLADPTGSGALLIEELTASRMVLNVGAGGHRLVCDRR